MSKTQFIYNQIGAFTGPAPGTGFHFLTTDGILNNFPDSGNYNLLFPLRRVQSTSYSVNPVRTNINSLGYMGTLTRPILNETESRLSINYLQMGLINEARLGFMFSYVTGTSGENMFPNRVCPISGFYTRFQERDMSNGLGWPSTYRDSRNLFFAIKKNTDDYNDTNDANFNNSNIYAMGFGDCYLTNYKAVGGVGIIPSVTVDFVFNNYSVSSSGSGISIPAINSQNGLPYSGIFCSIPNNFESSGQRSVFLPQNITLTIKESGNANPLHLFSNIDDIKIQTYEIDLPLNRESIYKINYKYPLDKKLSFPIFASLNVSYIPGEHQRSSMAELLRYDIEHDISIKFQYQNNFAFTGIGIQYDFLGAKLTDYSESFDIQNRKNINLSFSTEIHPNKRDKGFFMSGQLGILTSTSTEALMILEGPPETGYVLTELDDIIMYEGTFASTASLLY